MRRTVLAAVLASAIGEFPAALAAGPAEATPRGDLLAGEKIWDMTQVPDREKTRLEFPHLVRFRDAWYCSFREGEIHGNHPSGRGRVIRSADAVTWQSVAVMEWHGGDVRDPRLSVTADGQLMLNSSIYFVSRQPRAKGGYYQLDSAGTPASELEKDVARQSVTWLSADGEHWSGAHACPSGVNTWRWDVRWHNGMGYSVGYAGKDGAGTLYRTRDGKSWRVLLEDFFPEGKGNEAALAFGADDTACCLLRGGPTRAVIGVAAPPFYQTWQWKNARVDWQGDGTLRAADDVFRVSPGGPSIIRLADGRLVGAARVDGRVTLFWIDPAAAVFTKLVQVDGTSYPGLVEHDGLLWITYGTRDSAEIRLAKIRVPD